MNTFITVFPMVINNSIKKKTTPSIVDDTLLKERNDAKVEDTITVPKLFAMTFRVFIK